MPWYRLKSGAPYFSRSERPGLEVIDEPVDTVEDDDSVSGEVAGDQLGAESDELGDRPVAIEAGDIEGDHRTEGS